MESIRSCRCTLRNSCRCCASWNSSIAAAFTAPESLDRFAHFVALLLGLGDRIGVGDRLVARRQLFDRAVQLLAAGLVEELQLGLFAHQLDFDLRPLLVPLLHQRAQHLQLLLAGAQRLAHPGVLRRHLVDARFQLA